MEIRDSKYFKQFSNPASSDLISSWWGISYEQRMENGIKHLKAYEYDAAITEFNEALKLNPPGAKAAEAYYYLGVAYQEKGVLHQKKSRKENAVEAYINSINSYKSAILNDSKLHPFDIHYNLGFVYSQKWALSKCARDFHFAIAEYEEAITRESEPDLKANAHNNLGNLYEEEGSLNKAIKHFKQVVNLKPSNKTVVVAALYHLGYLYNEKKNYDKAANAYQELINCNSEDSRAHYNLSVTYYLNWITKKDKTLIKEAIKHCDKAITFGYKKVTPGFVKLLNDEALKLKYEIPPSFLPFLKPKRER